MTQNPPRHLAVGTVLQDGKYTILKVLGQGGFGITYLAKHIVYGNVALKELFLSSGSVHCSRENTTQKQVIANFEPAQFKSFKERFLQEAGTLFRLRKVIGVVHVQEIFEENDTAYFSMEYIEGDKLKDYVNKRKPLSEQAGLKIIQSLGKIISEIHKAGVLHRDIKPDNIIVGDAGEVHLIDFGIARNFVDKIEETHTTFHTPQYSPPEQKSSTSPMGTFSDIYSLGATAYFVFTGVAPLSLEDRLLNEYLPPNQHIPTLSTSINNTINKSLILKSQNRIQTADEFLAALNGQSFELKDNLESNNKKTIENQILQEQENQIPLPVSNLSPNLDKTIVESNKHTSDGEATRIEQMDKKSIPILSEATLVEQSDKKTDAEKTEIYSSPPNNVITKEGFNWQGFQNSIIKTKDKIQALFVQNFDLKTQKGKLLTGGITAILSLLLGLLFFPAKTPPLEIPPSDIGSFNVPIPHPDRFISIVVVDNFNQLLDNTKVSLSGNNEEIPMDRYGIFYRKIEQDWDSLKNKTLKIEQAEFLTEEISISAFAKETEETDTIRLISKLIPNAYVLVDSLKEYYWVSDQDSLSTLEFELEEDKSTEGNPEGTAKFNGKPALWSTFQTKENIIIKVEYVDSADYKEHYNFIVFNAFDEKKMRLELSESEEKNTYLPQKKNKQRKVNKTNRKYILSGKIIDANRNPISRSTIRLQGLNKRVRTDNYGKFYFDVTKYWSKLKGRSFEISKSGFITRERAIANNVNNRNLIIQLNPVRSNPAPIILRCDNLANTWWRNKNHVIFLKNCTGAMPKGIASYNGRDAAWRTYQKGRNLFLNIYFSSGKKGATFKIKNPQNKYAISLVDEKGGGTFSKSNKEGIFCNNILGNWEYKENSLNILNCKDSNLGGELIFNGKKVTYFCSQINVTDNSVIFNFKFEGKTHVFNVIDPLSPEKIKLEFYRKGKKTFNKKSRDIYLKQ